MDIIAHSIWTYVLFHKTSYLALALIFSLIPDLSSWGIFTIYLIFTGKKMDPKNIKHIPFWVFTLYGITHSIFIFSLAFFLLMSITQAVPLYMLAWLIHITIDIPTHSRDFLPTPFLWPVSNWKFPGISWAHKYVMITNYIALSIALFLTLG